MTLTADPPSLADKVIEENIKEEARRKQLNKTLGEVLEDCSTFAKFEMSKDLDYSITALFDDLWNDISRMLKKHPKMKPYLDQGYDDVPGNPDEWDENWDDAIRELYHENHFSWKWINGGYDLYTAEYILDNLELFQKATESEIRRRKANANLA